MKALDDAEVALSMHPGWVKGLFRKGKALAGLKVSGRRKSERAGRCSLLNQASLLPSFLSAEVRRSRASLQAGCGSGRFLCRRRPRAHACSDSAIDGGDPETARNANAVK